MPVKPKSVSPRCTYLECEYALVPFVLMASCWIMLHTVQNMFLYDAAAVHMRLVSLLRAELRPQLVEQMQLVQNTMQLRDSNTSFHSSRWCLRLQSIDGTT